GDPADLLAWQHMLKHQSDVWVETHNGETVLRATSLDALQSAGEVRDRAIAYIDRLNGAMALSHDSRPVQITRAGVQFTQDRHVRHRNFPVGRGGFEYRGSVATISPTVIGPSEVQRWSAIADQETLLDDALTYFGRATDWFDIHKALECLEEKFGGE